VLLLLEDPIGGPAVPGLNAPTFKRLRSATRSDNGSCYISKEFYGLLEYHGLTHSEDSPHCLEEMGG
jgi:hypothetical protein